MFGQQFRQKIVKALTGNAAKIALGLGLLAIAPGLALAHDSGSNNVYFFGTTPEAGQMGHDYIVMEMGEDNEVSGVVYQLHSEFACFSGEADKGTLNLAIVDPYEQVAYDYQLDYTQTALVADAEAAPATQLIPDGFYLIETLSTLASNVLAQCAGTNTVM